MTSILLKKHADFTRNLIKDTFMELFSKQSLKKITVIQICEECGISRSAFYKYYDDKYEVLEDIEDQIIGDLRDLNQDMHSIPFQDKERTIPKWKETAEYILDNKAYIQQLLCVPGESLFVHKLHAIIKNSIFQRLSYENQKQSELDILSYTMSSATIGLYEYWFRFKPELTPLQIAEIGTQLLWSSFYLDSFMDNEG